MYQGDHDEFDRERNDVLQKRLQLGEKARMFLNSDIGTVLLDRVVNDRLSARSALEVADPHDAELISKLQRNAQVPLAALQLVLDLVQEAEEVKELIAEEEQDEY